MTVSIKERCLKIIVCLVAGTVCHSAAAYHSTSDHMIPSSAYVSSVSTPSVKFFFKRPLMVFQVGGFNASQGIAQDIGINGLIGNRYTVNQQHGSNVLLGLGFYLKGFEKDKVNLLYGINAFYLLHTSVQGDVIQEQLFTNLSYHYSITNYPVYAAAKMLFKTRDGKSDVTVDLGIGPNFISTNNYAERSLDGGMTIPDNAFSGKTSVALSFTAGVGIKFNNLVSLPCELSYRFFYLGQGSLQKNNDQLLDTLKTGYNVANALIFSIYA